MGIEEKYGNDLYSGGRYNIREIERYALKNSGYEVEEFEGSASFFKRLEKNIPSLILLDIMLPGEDGLDILTRIRADRRPRMSRSLW